MVVKALFCKEENILNSLIPAHPWTSQLLCYSSSTSLVAPSSFVARFCVRLRAPTGSQCAQRHVPRPQRPQSTHQLCWVSKVLMVRLLVPLFLWSVGGLTHPHTHPRADVSTTFRQDTLKVLIAGSLSFIILGHFFFGQVERKYIKPINPQSQQLCILLTQDKTLPFQACKSTITKSRAENGGVAVLKKVKIGNNPITKQYKTMELHYSNVHVIRKYPS